MPGRLARENAERQPQRTAITASALMIGPRAGRLHGDLRRRHRGSIDKVIDEQLSRSALIVTHDDGFSPVPPDVAERLEQVQGVDVVSPMRWDQANVKGGGDSVAASGVDPVDGLPAVRAGDRAGRARRLLQARDDQLLADDGWAKDHKFAVGDRLEVTTPKGEVRSTSWSARTTTSSTCSAASSSRTAP
jgi:putative ABC transport system permease protein